MSSRPKHDLYDFIRQQEASIHWEYERVSRRVREDPGTAGDSIEQVCWKELFENWLPGYFRVRNKGRILFESGVTSPQIDVVVFSPSYPPYLENKLHHLSCGVVAAFECKATLKREHIFEAVKTAAYIRQNSKHSMGTPYRELVPEIAYGLIANTHDWKKDGSNPISNITEALWEAEKQFVAHPRECLDFVCVADLACWSTLTYARRPHPFPGDVATLHPCMLGSSKYARFASGDAEVEFVDRDAPVKSPVFYLLQCLIDRFAWEHKDMRRIAKYFARMRLRGEAKSKVRIWKSEDIFSWRTLQKLEENEGAFDDYSEWARTFG